MVGGGKRSPWLLLCIYSVFSAIHIYSLFYLYARYQGNEISCPGGGAKKWWC